MHRPGMWSLSRAAGQTGVPSQQLVLWQVDVVLASYMGLNSADITAAYPTMCVFVCVRVCVIVSRRHAQQSEPRGRPCHASHKSGNTKCHC